MGVLAYFRVFGVGLAGVRGCVSVVTGGAGRDGRFLDAFGPTGGVPSVGDGRGLVYGGARVGVGLAGCGIGRVWDWCVWWGGVGVRLLVVVRGDVVAFLGAAASSGLFEVMDDGSHENGEGVRGEAGAVTALESGHRRYRSTALRMSASWASSMGRFLSIGSICIDLRRGCCSWTIDPSPAINNANPAPSALSNIAPLDKPFQPMYSTV